MKILQFIGYMNPSPAATPAGHKGSQLLVDTRRAIP